MSTLKELLIDSLEDREIELYEGEHETDIDKDDYTFTISYSLEKEDGDFYSEEYNDDDEPVDGKFVLTINSVYANGSDADDEPIKLDGDIEFAIREAAVYNVGDEEDTDEDYL